MSEGTSTVALPLWSTFRSIELTKIMGLGAVVDLIVIPWPYVLATYVKKGGDRWRPVPAQQS
jgi:hypothetical protein